MSAAHPNELIPKHDTPKHGVPLIQEGRLLENPLSEREMEVAQLLSTGASNSEIAHTLIISPHTVKVHLRNIFEKLQVNSRTEASMLLVQRGWLTVPGIEIPLLIENASELELEVVPPVPDPDPLPAVSLQLANWQRLYLLGVLFLALLAFFLPSLRSRASAAPNLLSDAGQSGSPAAQVLTLPRWQVLTSLPEPRSRMALVYLNEQIFVIGGETTGGRIVATVDAYTMAFNDWRKQVALPAPLSNSAATVISGTIYLAGGSEFSGEGEPPTISNALLEWREGATQWSRQIDLPNRLVGAALVADTDSLYLIGGWDGEQMHDEVWRLAFSAHGTPLPNWQLLTRIEPARAFLGAAIVDQQLYVVGGSDGQRNSNTLAAFDLDRGKWQSLAPLPTARHGFSLVYDGSALFVIGGDEISPSPIHQRYDMVTNEWTNIPSPVQGLWRHLGATSVNGRIFAVGGWSGDYLASALEYQSSYRLLLPVISKDQ